MKIFVFFRCNIYAASPVHTRVIYILLLSGKLLVQAKNYREIKKSLFFLSMY